MTATATDPEQMAREIGELRARLAQAEDALRNKQGGAAGSLSALPGHPDPESERKQAETDLRHRGDLEHSEARFRACIETMLDPFAIMRPLRDAAGQIVDFSVEYANGAVYTAIGAPENEIMGKHMLDLLPGHKPTGLFDALCHVVNTGTPLVMESFQ